MTFHFTADCKFDAENLDGAFLKLSQHFDALREGKDSELEQVGAMELKPDGTAYVSRHKVSGGVDGETIELPAVDLPE